MASITHTLEAALGADVIDFAAERGVADFLHPVLNMTQALFPDARRIEALLEYDPELANDCHIVFEVAVGPREVSHTVDQHWQWSRNLFQLCPATHTCLFGLHVKSGDA